VFVYEREEMNISSQACLLHTHIQNARKHERVGEIMRWREGGRKRESPRTGERKQEKETGGGGTRLVRCAFTHRHTRRHTHTHTHIHTRTQARRHAHVRTTIDADTDTDTGTLRVIDVCDMAHSYV